MPIHCITYVKKNKNGQYILSDKCPYKIRPIAKFEQITEMEFSVIKKQIENYKYTRIY